MKRSGLSDLEYEATKARLTHLFKLWTNRLGLGWWQVDIEYETDRSFFADGSNNGVNIETLMTCAAEWEYTKATIVVNMTAASQMDDEALESCVIHELCHVLVCEMRIPHWADAPNEILQIQRDHEERVVTWLAKAFGWVFLAGKGDLSGETDESASEATAA